MANSAYLRRLVATRTLMDTELFPTLYLSLHSDDPDETGEHELEGGKYERQEIRFAHFAAGVLSNENRVDFEDLPATAVTYFGIWGGDTYLLGGSWDRADHQSDLRVKAGELTLRMG